MEIPDLRAKTGAALSALIQCKTISSRDGQAIDQQEFRRFYETLAALFPLVHRHCPLERIGAAGLLYHWQGKENDAPVVLMSHFDVVPAEDAKWEKPPFAGIIEDGVLWGRGSLDTKQTLCGILCAAEYLLEKGFVPARDIYFSFGGDEEVHGASCLAIVSWLEQKGIRPSLVIDEGGAIVDDVFPGVKLPCALIGIGEKGVLDVECSLESPGGHASTPPPHTGVGQLAQAVVALERKPFPAELTVPVKTMYETLGRHSSFGYRLIFANLWCFLPLLAALGRRAGGNLNTFCAEY
jgi:carboxypeptidase PM20D1